MADSLLAVFADVHANLEALQAVLADMEAQAVGQRVCLGDVVGYAADPAQCVELVRSLGCPVVQGNHDAATATDAGLDAMRDVAQIGIEFARLKLSREQRDYLAGLPLTVSDGKCQFVHASLNAPGDWHYIVQESEAREHFQAQAQPICFCGHSHVPSIWHLSNTGNLNAGRGQGRSRLPAEGKILINAGSVGQPRDLCSASCYALYNSNASWVEFRRVTYDIQKTRSKILRAKLPRYVAQRLSLGR